MRMIRKLGFAPMALLCGPLWGQTPGAYVGVAFGESEMVSPSGLVQPSDPPVVQRIQDTDTGYKLFLGYRVNRFFGVEASLVDYGETTPEVLGKNTIGEDVFVQMANQAAQFSALAIYPLADGAIGLFGRIGVSYVYEELGLFVIQPVPVPGVQTDVSSVRPLLGFGAQFNFGPERKIGVRLEWETTDGDVFERTDFFSVGVTYRFGRSR